MYQYQIIRNRCTLTFSCPQEVFCHSLTCLQFLPGLTISSSYTHISFFAKSVRTLSSYIDRQPNGTTSVSYSDGVAMAKHIGTQIFHLEQHRHTFAWLDLNNVLVINDAVFLYVGVDDVVSLHPSGHFTLATPIRFRDVPLASPELRKIHTLPASLSHTAVYYSLAALVCQSMFANVDPTTLHQDTECLQPIVETRLYWFLLRALVPDPEDRTCLFI